MLEKATAGLITRSTAQAAAVESPQRRLLDYEGAHALLVVREAPRTGERVTKRGGSGSTLAAAKNLQPRNPVGKIVFASDDFIVDVIQETDQERYSVSYTFADPVVQAASEGRQPRLYTYAGTLLINGVLGSALARWLPAWETWLRATANLRGADRRATPWVAEISYRDQFRRGYLVNTAFERSSELPGRASFSLTLFVVHESSLAALAQSAQVTTTPAVTASKAAAPGITEFRA